MKNALPFDCFVKTLKKTNRTLDFFVDWQKCLEKRHALRVSLRVLNNLLGVSPTHLESKVQALFDQNPQAFQALPLLLAMRNAQEIVLTPKQEEKPLSGYLQSPEKICAFLCQSGLLELFSTRKIKDLDDFILGVEVGLDSNARKNRGGFAMEAHLRDMFKHAHLEFSQQVSVKHYPDLHRLFGEDVKRFDFVILGKQGLYFVECNFYTSAGSKLNEVARAYQELAPRFEGLEGKYFVWITDGQGWLSCQNKLEEAYKSVCLYNLAHVDHFIKGVQNGF
ncbi:type II restriction enzyme MjaIII [Helicobacter bizzozeronii CIII-1]|uniref:Type-2 restriction enzyme n=1 Tax=Helicobacter bizzozeronii (strain CIII-1) TaxID=1002804 RepID=F8KPT8_HELBC|nr:type II restriction endonuclease [Helicobacter bizzozeronii]CCB80832.1 type II restriction enzyme MjaIII [Helicobacter bizzozeronii CIII-1]